MGEALRGQRERASRGGGIWAQGGQFGKSGTCWGEVTAGPCFATLESHCEWTSISEPLENRLVTLSHLIHCLKSDILTMAGQMAKTCLTPG